jgi:NAD:arginine ADP-ribosyltransferase
MEEHSPDGHILSQISNNYDSKGRFVQGRMDSIPEVKALIESCELSSDEAQAIVLYAGNCSKKLNGYLENDHPDKPFDHIQNDYAEMLSRALAKLPSHSNQVVVNQLFERRDLKLEWFEGREGQLVRLPRFISTFNLSLDSKRVKDNPDIFYIIETSSQSRAKDINPICGKDSELEVLFDKGTVFRVVGIESLFDKQVVRLQELEDQSTPGAIDLYSCFEGKDKLNSELPPDDWVGWLI